MENIEFGKQYESIETFLIEKCDADGCHIENSEIVVRNGSIWGQSEFTIGIADIHLENQDGTWIEINKEDLKSFREI